MLSFGRSLAFNALRNALKLFLKKICWKIKQKEDLNVSDGLLAAVEFAALPWHFNCQSRIDFNLVG